MTKEMEIIANKEQGLYVIPCGKGFSCLGFDVLLERLRALSEELHLPIGNPERGSIKAYEQYQKVIDMARAKHEQSGWRSKSELYSPFIGHEGRRVEVEYTNGEKERFYIGRSTGFIPCHLMIKKINSTGGGAVMGSLIKSFTFLSNKVQ
jgi:hypothetical protein